VELTSTLITLLRFGPSPSQNFKDNLRSFVLYIKGSNRLCKVVELSMQCCGKLLSDPFERHIKLFKDL